MRLLLDTHTFLWWDSDPSRLSAHVRMLCEDPENQLVVSVVSLWQIQIKTKLGKLTLPPPLAEIVSRQQQDNGVEVLPVSLEHVLALDELPTVHSDPFDRLLIAQARAEDVAILTRDPVFERYPVQAIWLGAELPSAGRRHEPSGDA